MNRSTRTRLPRLLLLAAAVSLGLPAHANDLNKRLKVKQDVTEVVMGQVMHDFYMGRGFTALNNILAAKDEGLLSDDVTATEILLGDLYTAFGMPEAADNVFSRIVTRDMRSDTRNETWFRQGRLKYRQGNYFEAERVLNVPISTTDITILEAERRVMLANILMAQSEFERARDLLAPIPMDTALGMYATYNMGVAHIRANQPEEGIRLLETVRALPVSDNETNALKDRAALAIGYSHLQAKAPEKARDALVNVRLEGPFSNSAMLALGYAHFLRNDYKRALSFWLELLTRNPGDSSVQEAMLLVPRAYEALQANQQAFFGYKLAAQTMNDQLEALEGLRTRVQSDDWLDQLNPSADGGANADPLEQPHIALPGNRTETAFMSSLLASHAFHEGYMQFQQLRRLQSTLKRRRDDLRAMRDVASQLQRRNPALTSAEKRASALSQQVQALNDHWPALQARARAAARNPRNFTETMAPQDRERLERIDAMEYAARRLPDTPAQANLLNRLRMVKGLHAFNVANKAPRTQNQVFVELTRHESELAQVRRRTEALRQLLDDNRSASKPALAQRTVDQEKRLGDIEKSIQASMNEHRAYLGALAMAALEDKRSRLNNDLAEAHLNIARLQDAALTRDLRSADTTGTPSP